MTANAKSKNGKTQATKTTPKKAPKKVTAPAAPVSVTPLLDAAKVNNPHKAEAAGGWDAEAAKALAIECGTLLARDPAQSLMEAVQVINEYKNFCGWGNAIQATSIGLGLSQPTRKLPMQPVVASK